MMLDFLIPLLILSIGLYLAIILKGLFFPTIAYIYVALRKWYLQPTRISQLQDPISNIIWMESDEPPIRFPKHKVFISKLISSRWKPWHHKCKLRNQIWSKLERRANKVGDGVRNWIWSFSNTLLIGLCMHWFLRGISMYSVVKMTGNGRYLE